MGSGWGYEYEYRFWVDEDIIHRYSRRFTVRDDIKFLLEMRTNFILKDPLSDSGSGSDEMIIDTERFEVGADASNSLFSMFVMRLEDYWFMTNEIFDFTTQARDFADKMRGLYNVNRQQHVTPIAIEMDVRTVRDSSETLAEARDRAIVSEKLFPLLLLYNRNAFVNYEKSPYKKLSLFLKGPDLDLDRVVPQETVDRRLNYLLKYTNLVSIEGWYCYVCGKAPKIAEEIVKLEDFCGHAFHYHCFIRSMLNDVSCPRCSYSLSAAVEDHYPITGSDLVSDD